MLTFILFYKKVIIIFQKNIIAAFLLNVVKILQMACFERKLQDCSNVSTLFLTAFKIFWQYYISIEFS